MATHRHSSLARRDSSDGAGPATGRRRVHRSRRSPYWPVKFGSLRSMNAAIPSVMSAVVSRDVLRTRLVLDRLFEARAVTRVEEALDKAQRSRGTTSQPPPPRCCRLEEPLGWHDLVHETPFKGCRCVDPIAEESHLLGTPEPDLAGKCPGSTTVHRQSALYEHLGEACSIAGDDEITGEDESERHAHGVPVNRSNRRLGQALQPSDDLADDAHLMDDELHAVAREAPARPRHGAVGFAPFMGIATRQSSGQIGPGGEVPTGTCEHQRTIGRRDLHLGQHLVEVVPVLGVQSVLLVRPVQRHNDESALRARRSSCHLPWCSPRAISVRVVPKRRPRAPLDPMEAIPYL